MQSWAWGSIYISFLPKPKRMKQKRKNGTSARKGRSLASPSTDTPPTNDESQTERAEITRGLNINSRALATYARLYIVRTE